MSGSGDAMEMRSSKASIFSKKGLKVKGKHGDKGGFVFKSNKAFVCALLLSVMETFSLMRLFTMTREYRGVAFLLPFIVTFFLLGLPLLLSQLFLGLYAGAGILKIWRLAPFASGLGYSMLIICIINIMATCRNISILLLCMIYTIAASDQWTSCEFVENGQACYVTEPDNIDNATKEIIEKGCCKADLDEFDHCPNKAILALPYSAFIRLGEEFFDKDYSMKDSGFGTWNIYLVATLAVNWALVFVSLYLGIRILNKVVIPLCVVLGLTFLVILLCVYIGGGTQTLVGIEAFFEMSPQAFLRIEMWTNCVGCALETLHLLCGSYFIFGSFAPKNTNPITATVTVGIIKIITSVLGVSLHTALQVTLAKLLHAPRACLIHHEWAIVYAIPAQFFGTLEYPQVWTFLYFFFLFVMDMANVVLMLFAIVESVLDLKPKLREYYMYMVLGLCLTSFLLSLPLVTQAAVLINPSMQLVALAIGDVVLTCYAAVLMWLYGVQRFADDLHFYIGRPPSKFWVFMWYFSPMPLVLVLLPEAYGIISQVQMIDSNVFQPMNIGLAILMLCPIPIAAIYEIRIYIKASRILSAFVPTREWGMVDKEERKRRLHFDPHKIVRFKADAPLKHRPAGLLSKRHIKLENDRLENHRKIFLEYFKAKEESAATGGGDVPLPGEYDEYRDGRNPEAPDNIHRSDSMF